MARCSFNFSREQLANAIRLGSLLFESESGYANSDRGLRSLFRALGAKGDVGSVLVKAAAVNGLYRTAIGNIHKMGEHIARIPNLQTRLQRGDISLVDCIRSNHGIRTKKAEKEYDFYSFATKYCAWHNPSSFPIWDNLVSRLVSGVYRTLLREYGTLTQEDLKDYGTFSDRHRTLGKELRLQRMGAKKLDQGMWMVGKALFDPLKLGDSLTKRIRKTLGCTRN